MIKITVRNGLIRTEDSYGLVRAFPLFCPNAYNDLLKKSVQQK